MAKSKVEKPKRLPAQTEPASGPPPVNMRGLKCPLPALKTSKLLAKMSPGEVLTIECTDPLTTIDIPNLVRETGDKIEDNSKSGRVLTFRIRKS